MSDHQRQALHHFHGGLMLAAHHVNSTATPIENLTATGRLVLPLRQHKGFAAIVMVEVGQRVLKNQPIASSRCRESLPIHAPTSGIIVKIEKQLTPQSTQHPVDCVILESDDQQQLFTESISDNYDPRLFQQAVHDAGIAGLGGAVFPAAIKLSPPLDIDIHTMIINGAECEPYISSDDMLMQEQPEDIIQGLLIMASAMGAKNLIIAVEDDKPKAIKALRSQIKNTPIKLKIMPTLYPSGGEKQLIKILTGLELAEGKIPSALGIIVHNVATAAAVYAAVRLNQPLIDRVVTVSGPGIKQAKNFRVPLGTPIKALIAACGGYTGKPSHLIMGGPMMGVSLPSDDLPVVKSTNCILVFNQLVDNHQSACIRCAECVHVCPANLLPHEMYWQIQRKEFQSLNDLHLNSCIECGACAYVCPSHIALLANFISAKQQLKEIDRLDRKTQQARIRFEARQQRLQTIEAAKLKKRTAMQAQLKG